MKRPIHEGILSQDKYKRYCLYELGVASAQNADLHIRMPTRSLAQSSMDRLPTSKATGKITGYSPIQAEDYS
jgi:hypothetical protein